MEPNLKICAVSGVEFEVTLRDKQYYQKLGVPQPTLCPRERARRRMAIRNERNLYKRKSDMSGSEIISMFNSDCPFPVFTKEQWFSDKWDATDYAQNLEFNKSFFEQFFQLQSKVPRSALGIFANYENSDFCNYVGDIKNCYLCFGSIFIEDCMYGNPYYSKNCVDCFLLRNSELCYECIDCDRLYHCAFLQDCYDCSNCFYSYDLKGCRDCIGCVGLRKKQHHIFNKPYSKEDYGKFLKEFSFCDREKIKFVKAKMEELKKNYPRLAAVILNCENCSGNYVFDSKNCHNCFQISKNEDCSYNVQTVENRDCYDMNYTEENELCYEYLGNYRNYKALFSAFCHGCSDIFYCDYTYNCKNCLGCVGLKNKEFCILNKQYSQSEYFDLVERLKKMMTEFGEWGEFFPIKYSPFAYNESVAFDYFPLSREEALARGYRWRDENKTEFKKSDYLPPSDIKAVGDDICEKVLSCEVSGRNYKITPAELKFYRRMGLPIPRKHFIERHKARLSKSVPYELYQRKCDKCGVEIQTAYEKGRPEKVYCEKCYLTLIY